MSTSRDKSSGRLLRRARDRAGLTQAELASRAGVAQSVISAYESGARQPSLPTLRRLVAATGLELAVSLRGPTVAARLRGPLGQRVLRHRRDILALAGRHGASHVRVFGSVARGTDTPASDVDFLVDLDPDVGLLALARLEHDLSALLGARVDIVPAGDLKPSVADNVATEVIAL